MGTPSTPPRPPVERTWLRLVVVLVVVGPLFALAAFWTPSSDRPVVDPRNAQAFIQDNLWTDGDTQYAVWVGDDASPTLGRRQRGGDWSSIDLGRLPGNPLAAPTIDDTHNVYAVAVDAMGHVHVAGNMHSEPLRYIRTASPGRLDEWVSPELGGLNERVTYPMFAALPDGTLLFFRREGIPSEGTILLDRLAPGETTWTHMGAVIDGAPAGESAYLQRVTVDPATGTVHLAWVWRAGPSFRDNSDIGYMRSLDGGTTWTTSTGESLDLPVTRANAEIVVEAGDGVPPINSGGMVVDGDGHPHLAMSRDGAVLHVRHDGEGWIEAQPFTAFGGRPGLVTAPDGSVWAVGLRGRVLRAEQLFPDVGPSVDGPALTGRFEATFDSQLQAARRDVEILVPEVGAEAPTVVELDLS